MQVLDRYLAAVARHLPGAQAADITAELRENLLSEIEEREAGLGRKLDAKELDALLIGFGHPLAVAARYRKSRSLIGPEIYPFWMAALRVAFGIYVAIALIGLAVAWFSGHAPAPRVAQVLAEAWPSAFMVFGAVTLVFAVMERAWNGSMKLHWSPRQLPQPSRAPGRKASQVISELVAEALFVLWWTGLAHIPAPVPSFVHVHLAPIWTTYYWPILGLTLAEMAINGLELARPGWVRLNAGLAAAKGVASLAVMYEVLQAGHWLEVSNDIAPPYAVQLMRHGFDRGMQIGLQVALVIIAIKAAWDGWRAIRGGSRGAGPAIGTTAVA